MAFTLFLLFFFTLFSTTHSLSGVALSDTVDGFLGLPYAKPPIGDNRFVSSLLEKLDQNLKYDKWPNRCIKDFILEGTSENCLYVNLLRHKEAKTKTNTLLIISNDDLSEKKLVNLVKPELNIAVGHIRDGILGYAGGLPLSTSDTVNLIKYLKVYSDTFLIRNLTILAEGTIAESVAAILPDLGYVIDQAILINGNELTRTDGRDDFTQIAEELLKKETECDKDSDYATLKCLRAKPLENILDAGQKIKKAFFPMGDPFRVTVSKELPQSQIPTMLVLYKRPTNDYPSDSNFTAEYNKRDFKRFMSLLLPETQYNNAHLLRRQVLHEYVYTKGEKSNLYFLFEQLKTILLDRDFLAPTYKLAQWLADKKNTVWLLEYGIDNPPRNCLQDGGWNDIQPFCDKIFAYYTRFAEKSAPTEDSCNPANPTFPALRSSKRDYYVIIHADGSVEWEFRFHKEAVELWNYLLPLLDKLQLKEPADKIFKQTTTLMLKENDSDYVLRAHILPNEHSEDTHKDKTEL